MTTLKLKAAIYRYTGLYLAENDKMAYIESVEFMVEKKRILAEQLPSCEDPISDDAAESILIGMWEFKHGFYTSWVFFGYEPRWFWEPIERVCSCLKNIKWDLVQLFKKGENDNENHNN